MKDKKNVYWKYFLCWGGFEKNIIPFHRVVENGGSMGIRVKNVLIDDYEIYSPYEAENLYHALLIISVENVIVMETPSQKSQTLKDVSNYKEYKL